MLLDKIAAKDLWQQAVRETVRKESPHFDNQLISLVGPAGLEPATRPL
jgi:hypothetical protein